jgi:outer membrane beta-barrel protein
MILPGVAHAQNQEPPQPTPRQENAGPRIAIQRPKYQMAHEFAFTFGTLPLDAFQKVYTANFSYTVHSDSYLAWEVLRFTAGQLTSTNLRDELINTFAIPPEDFAAPRFMATTGLEVTPLYGKMVFLNDTVVHQALFLGIYGGAIFGDRGTISKTVSDLRPAGGLGMGYRVFLTKLVSFRIDVRDFESFKRAIRSNERFERENVLSITAGFSFNLWRDDA